jgi:hypothetical protein
MGDILAPVVSDEPPASEKKPPAAQRALDLASGDCTAFAALSDRLERARIAFEGLGAQPEGAAMPRGKPASHMEGLAFLHACNLEVIRRMEFAIGRFEDILDCRPEEIRGDDSRETK